MKWHWRDLPAQVAYRAGWHKPDAPDTLRADESDVDAALRYILRAEVAGAAPSADSWRLLRGRIARGELRRDGATARVPGPAAGTRIPRLRATATFLRPYASQVSLAMLLLLTMLGALLPSAPWARLVPVATDGPGAAASAPSRQIVRINRAEYVLDDAGDVPATAVPTSVPAQDDPTLALVATGRGPDGLGAVHPNRATQEEPAAPDKTDIRPGGHLRRPNTPADGLQPW